MVGNVDIPDQIFQGLFSVIYLSKSCIGIRGLECGFFATKSCLADHVVCIRARFTLHFPFGFVAGPSERSFVLRMYGPTCSVAAGNLCN